jgi:hypothetical protein
MTYKAGDPQLVMQTYAPPYGINNENCDRGLLLDTVLINGGDVADSPYFSADFDTDEIFLYTDELYAS